MRRSTFYDEDLSDVVDLSEHGTWANANLCEIILLLSFLVRESS